MYDIPVRCYSNSISLVSPSTNDCEAIMIRMKQQQPRKSCWVYLKSSYQLSTEGTKYIADFLFDTNSTSELS